MWTASGEFGSYFFFFLFVSAHFQLGRRRDFSGQSWLRGEGGADRRQKYVMIIRSAEETVFS
jgi:hypothetical protein